MTNYFAGNPDEEFHFEIWQEKPSALLRRMPSISYCENHNGDFDYGLAATDFEMAAEAILETQRRNSAVANWVAPVLHLIRQTIELKTKALIQTIEWRTTAELTQVKFGHDLEKLWAHGRNWLIVNGYPIETDARLANTDRLIANFHAIDPLGDLFRFGTSRKSAFGRLKSSDRVGFELEKLSVEFEDSCGALNHWCGVILREIIQAEQGWETDPFFDKEDFPKLTPTSDS